MDGMLVPFPTPEPPPNDPFVDPKEAARAARVDITQALRSE